MTLGQWLPAKVSWCSIKDSFKVHPIDKQRCYVAIRSDKSVGYRSLVEVDLNDELCSEFPPGKRFNIWIEEA